MQTQKVIFPVALVAVCSFALGICFHRSLPQPDREIASIGRAVRAPSSKFDLRVTRALKDCMAEKAGPSQLPMTKVVVDGRDWSVVSVDCVGKHAKALYEAVVPYSSEQYVRYSDGRRGVARFFGRLYPPSQCVRVIRTARGSELNLYSCSISIDLDHELIEALKL
jgi:hypothetical protein